ncbi:MAG: rRNA pseudouridine synthase [Deltaproteobacteria bacterium]|nr:rRNA pseudouridine synthase [Deltaproteobacteria bacterium]
MNGKRKIRLQKFLSQAGVCSRREGEKKILAGRVKINGQVVKEMGVLVDPESDRVVVDQAEIRGKESHVYYIFHKPKNVMVTRDDPEKRPTIYDYLKNIKERVNYVGRLDFDSEGLVFLTNDGELHHRMTHPSQEIPKRYRVKILDGLEGQTSRHPPYLKQLSSGIDIGDYVTAPCQVRILDSGWLGSGAHEARSLRAQSGRDREIWLEITITEGKNRQIRRMCEAVGLEVLRLIRVAVGPLELGDLRPRTFRPLTAAELKKLTEISGESGRGTKGRF